MARLTIKNPSISIYEEKWHLYYLRKESFAHGVVGRPILRKKDQFSHYFGKPVAFAKQCKSPDLNYLFELLEFLKLFELLEFLKLFELLEFLKLSELLEFLKLFELREFLKSFELLEFLKLFELLEFLKLCELLEKESPK